MGGINFAVPQQLGAAGMEADFSAISGPESNPAFLYLAGDCVYFNGETSKYYEQFYHPYPSTSVPSSPSRGTTTGGRLVRALRSGPLDVDRWAHAAGWPRDPARAARVASSLVADGLAVRQGDQLRLP